MNWSGLGFYVLDRFKEPSTYVSIAGMVLASGHAMSPDLTTQITGLCVGLACTLGVLLKEGK